MHEQQGGRRCDQAERREILARVVAGIAEQAWPGRQRGRIAQQNRIAVGRDAMRDLACRDGAAAAGGAVLDDDLLAERCAELIGDRTCHDVIAAARRLRNDQRDRAARIGLRHRRCSAKHDQGRNRDDDPACRHRRPFPHSPFKPIACTSFDHRFSSRSISATYSSGAPGIGSAPSSASRFRTSSVASSAFNSRFSRSTIGRGVPAGASSVERCVASKPADPLRQWSGSRAAGATVAGC